jgi:hypothetical protein
MSVQVQRPTSNEVQFNVQVVQGNTTGVICARGTASNVQNGQTVYPTAMFALVYAGALTGNQIPATHPAAATAATTPMPMTSADWYFESVGTASCAVAGSPSYPSNTLAVWAVFANGAEQVGSSIFTGQCGPNVECTIPGGG